MAQVQACDDCTNTKEKSDLLKKLTRLDMCSFWVLIHAI